jgi:bifunctional UDP-N-acetylglucosamine pyrophosphorylase/glucosamine-1-phosphate N-acetyltransferase
MPHVIILAAGKGTRMQSDVPKVLHEVKGVPILLRLLNNISKICPDPTIIVGHQAFEIRAATGNAYQYVEQHEQLGTGHAVLTARDYLKDVHTDTVFVLPGDHPLIRAETLQEILSLHKEQKAVVTIGTAIVPSFEDMYEHFWNYGRVVRDKEGNVEKIVEFKHTTPEEKNGREVSLSYYCFDTKWLWDNIPNLEKNNAAAEYYLTDTIQMARHQGKTVAAFPIDNLIECMGINTPEQLKLVEETLS